MEVQFDEHKLLFVYAHDLEPFEEILIDAGLKRDDTLKFISEAETPPLDRRRLPRPNSRSSGIASGSISDLHPRLHLLSRHLAGWSFGSPRVPPRCSFPAN